MKKRMGGNLPREEEKPRMLAPLALLLGLVPCASAHNYTYFRGALAAGSDIHPHGLHTVAEAEAICSASAKCRGISFHVENGANATGPQDIYFKGHVNLNMDVTWSTFLKDYVPVPPPPPKLINPCINESFAASKMKWCDHTLGVDERVDDMVSHMSLSEKIGALRDESAPIASLDLPYYDWWNEATHGVASGEHGVRNTDAEPYQSNFPFPITTGMSFNRTLWLKTGAQIGRESRAFSNVGNAFSTFWAPVINLAREPRWGRNIECPGEDPYLSGEYAVAFVQGFERNPDDPTHLQASACCKHYAANSMEDTTEGGVKLSRHTIDANITQQDLIDSYLAPFQACVEQGKVSGLMCSYNAINGKPTCADSWLLQDVARDAWGFDGYITSDCGAESDVFINHHYTNTPEESVQQILAAGTDSDCGGFMGEHLQSALDKKLVVEADLDARLKMLFRVRMRLGHFDPLGPLDKIPASAICDEAAIATARDSVAQSVTLVKNADKTLPLSNATVKSVAVIGPSAKQPWSITSYYGPSSSCDGKYWTMVDAVQQYVNDTKYFAGLDATLSTNYSGIAAAAALAKTTDAVVLCVGTDLTSAHEEMDAVNITFPAAQWALVQAVAAAAAKPITVVIMTAVPLDISKVLTLENVGAVIHAGQPSVQTLGIGDVIFGEKVPAGRLIQTVYPEAYAAEVSIFDFNMRPGPSAFPRPDCTPADINASKCKLGTNPGRTYRFYTGEPVLPFGFGLSYTSFTYGVSEDSLASPVSLTALPELLGKSKAGFVPDADNKASGPAANFTISVTNTGDVDADDVVLGFLTPPNAGTGGAPLKTLFGFERVHVKKGETVSVYLYPQLTDFTHVDTAGVRVPLEGTWKLSVGCSHEAAGSASALGANAGMGYVEANVEARMV